MTDPLGAQSGAGGQTGQSAGTTDQGAGTAPSAAGGQSATGQTGTTTTTETGQSAVSREEFDRLRAQLQAADKARVAAEQAHAQLRDKDMPALQKAERDLQTSQAQLAEKDATISQLRLELAFFADNDQEWHNPTAALQLLDRSKITVDSEGKVTGMKDALKALATAHPYMLKPKPAGEGQGGGTGQQQAAPPPGTNPANGGIGQQQGTQPSAADLAKRFPALKQRLG